jgi:hypothetical protein
MRETFRQRRELLICGFLVLGTLAAFWPVHGYKYVDYDDNHYVTENANVKAGLTRERLIWAFGLVICLIVSFSGSIPAEAT